MDANHPSGTSNQTYDTVLLNRALVALELADELISVVRLVDWWCHRANPSVDALLAKARALIVMGQVDRSWQILRELSVKYPDRVDIKLLTARMFIERGWGARANRLLEEIPNLQSDDPRVRLLRDLMRQASSDVPVNAGEIARNGSKLQRLTLAKQYLLSGNQIRARTLLERLRQENVERKIVERMLFGIHGESDDLNKSQSEMLMELLGWSSLSLPKIGTTDLEVITDLGESDPETAEISKASRSALSGDKAAFPPLFRSLPVMCEGEGGEDESTQASVVQSLDDGLDPPTEEALLDEVQDTQIMEVIGAGESNHVQSEASGLRKVVTGSSHNLKEWAGSAADEVDEADEAGDTDEEDEEVIVLVDPKVSNWTDEANFVNRGPIEVLEKYPSPPPALRAPSKIETIKLPAYRGQLDEPTVELETWEDDGVEDYIRHRRNRHFRNRTILGLLLVLVLGAGLWWQMEPSVLSVDANGNTFESDAKALIVTGEVTQMEDESERLAQMMREDESLSVSFAVDRALLESFLYSDWKGSDNGKETVQELAALARVSGSKSTDLAMLEATLLWREAELSRAVESLQQAGAGELQEYLRLRIALERNAQQAIGSVSLAEMSPSLLVAFALHQPHEFNKAELSTLLDGHIESVDVANKRLLSNLLVARARLAFWGSEVDQGWLDQAVSVDSTNAEVQLLKGELAWSEGRMVEAASHFEQCLQYRPADVRCIRGAVATAYEMDRLDEAQWALNRWPESTAIDEDIECWMADLGQQPDCDSEHRMVTLTGMFVADLIRLQIGRESKYETEWHALKLDGKNEFSPMQNALLKRGKTLHALNQGDLASTGEWATEDLWVGLAQARREGTAPSQLFGQAGELARQKAARVMFEYAELIRPSFPQGSIEVLERYLDLLPTGPRADQAKKIDDSIR